MIQTVEFGHGERVVLVHGDIFDGESTWRMQQPLADHYRLVMMNRRGFGDSDEPDGGGEDFDVDAHDVIEVLGAGAHLVGHSYGAVVALLAAARRPDLVHSLAVFEPPAFRLVEARPDVQDFRHRIEQLVLAEPDPARFLPLFVAAVGGDPKRLPDPLPPPLVKAAGILLAARWPWEADIPVDVLARAPFPKLVVSGGHSEMFDSVCDALEQTTGARRAVIPGAGHSVPQVGEPVNAALRDLWSAGRGHIVMSESVPLTNPS